MLPRWRRFFRRAVPVPAATCHSDGATLASLGGTHLSGMGAGPMTVGKMCGSAGAALTVLAHRVGRLGGPEKSRCPALPPAPEPRNDVRMLAASDFLWGLSASDAEGEITLALSPFPNRHLGVFMDVDGQAVGLRLDQGEVQDLRHALTVWLCHTPSQRAA